MTASSGVRRLALSRKTGRGMPKKTTVVATKKSNPGRGRGNGIAKTGTHTRNIE